MKEKTLVNIVKHYTKLKTKLTVNLLFISDWPFINQPIYRYSVRYLLLVRQLGACYHDFLVGRLVITSHCIHVTVVYRRFKLLPFDFNAYFLWLESSQELDSPFWRNNDLIIPLLTSESWCHRTISLQSYETEMRATHLMNFPILTQCTNFPRVMYSLLL